MAEEDPFDQFFENLKEEDTHERGNLSSDVSESDPEEKALSFSNNFENTQKEEEKDDILGKDPQYVLPPDHKSIHYPEFRRNVVIPELQSYLDSISPDYADEWRDYEEIHVTNSEIRPVFRFNELSLGLTLVGSYLALNKITKPTPIQSQAIPIAMYGHNLIAVSPTGSGKTLSFLIPLIYHVTAQVRDENEYKGPIALIISPTDMLAQQTFLVLQAMTKDTKIKSSLLTGSSQKFKQESKVTKTTDIIVATPGRLMGFLETVDWRLCSFLVIDEADKIFETGFFRQLRSIVDYIRPDHQTLLFGATLPDKIEDMLSNSVKDAVRVQVGRVGAPQQSVEHQFVALVGSNQKKEWLINKAKSINEGLVLIFVKDRSFCDSLCQILMQQGIKAGFVHGNLDRSTRSSTFDQFRASKIRFLVSTEIAARGIDIPDISVIINFDVPEDPQSYIHRVGRTGRAGRIGTAYTLLTPRDFEYAKKILQHFTKSRIEPPEELIDFLDSEARKEGGKHFDFDF